MKTLLNSKQVSFLRGLAHKLEPVVTVGNAGVSEGVIKEIEFTLKTFELIKIKLRCDDQDELKILVDDIAAAVKASKIQVIGHTLVLYRRSKEPKIAVPGLPLPEKPVEEKEKSFEKKLGERKTLKTYGKSAPKREDSTKRWGRLARVKTKKDSSPASSSRRGEGRSAAPSRGFSRGSR